MIKVAIIGPESTGKTELAKTLADEYNGAWVPEYARGYLNSLDRDYHQSDLLKIASGQVELEHKMALKNPKVMFSDTDLHVIKVWSEHKYGNCDERILRQITFQHYHLYILTYHDIPYEEDPLRENPEQRDYFFDIYHQLLSSKELPFIVVKGDRSQRLELAKRHIDTLL